MDYQRKVTIRIFLVALAVSGLVGLGLVGLGLAGLPLGVYDGPRGFLSGFDRKMHAKYESISEGVSKKMVFDALGEPRAKSNEFNLPQRQGFELLFDAAEKSPAIEYYLWTNGINWYYCIGFDSAGTVAIKGEGNS